MCRGEGEEEDRLWSERKKEWEQTDIGKKNKLKMGGHDNCTVIRPE